jgi:hypothetical protein
MNLIKNDGVASKCIQQMLHGHSNQLDRLISWWDIYTISDSVIDRSWWR